MSNLNPATHPEDAAQVLQSCLPLRNPVDDSPAGSSVIGILQARILEWVTISFSKGPSLPRYWTLSLFSLLHWQVGSLQLHHHPKCTRHWVAFWCFFIWGIGNTHRKNYRTSNFRLRKGEWGNPGPQGSRSWGTPDSGTPRLAGTLRTREHPQGCRAARSPPACRSSGRLCLLHAVPRNPGLGRAGPPQPLSAAGGGLGVPPAAFGGLEARAGSCRGRWGSPHGGSSKRTCWTPGLLHTVAPQQLPTVAPQWLLAAPGLLHTVAPQCPQPPCKCKSCRRSQPSNLGGIWGQDLCPGETCSGHPTLVCMDCDHPLDMDLSHGSTFNTSAFTGVVAPEVRAQAGTQILCAVTHPLMGVPSTWGINSEGKYEGKSQVLNVQEKRTDLEFVMDRKAWHAAIHGVAKSHTWLSDWTELNWADRHMASGIKWQWEFCTLGYGHHSSACNRKQSLQCTIPEMCWPDSRLPY